MNHLLTTHLLWIFATTALPFSFADAQALPPVAPAVDVEPDPATDADFYLDKAAGKIAEIQTFVDSFRDKPDLGQYPFRPVFFSKRDIEQARHTLGLAKVQIDLLSDDVNTDRLHQHRRLLRRTERLAKYLTMIRTSLQASLDPKAFPDLRADAVRFRGLGMMLANIDSFESDPELAAAIIKQLPAAKQEANRIATKYDLLVQQETIAGLQLAGLERYFVSKRKSFEAIIRQHRQVLDEQIKSDLARVQATLLSPSERRLSASLESSPDELRSQLRKIEADLNLLDAIDPQSSEFLLTHRKLLFDLLAAVQETEPTDFYAGDDRDDLVKAISLWGTKSDLNRIRIPANNWTRRGYWQLSGDQWREINHSVLDVYFLAKNSDDASPSWQRILLTKDHLNEDAITARRDE